MQLPEYFIGLSEELQRQSIRIKKSFKSHPGTAGSNRETIISNFLQTHLPKKFGIGEGLIVSRNGQVSQQADIVIYDQQLNFPLNSDFSSQSFLVESVYALFEAKTNLTPSELKDSLKKCRRFKLLERQYEKSAVQPKISESLFIIFAFEASKPETFKKTLAEHLLKIPQNERPDLIVIPGSMIAKSGHYYEIAKIGQPGSTYRKNIEKNDLVSLANLMGDGFDIWELKDHTLFCFMIWLSSWLSRAGSRHADLTSYLPEMEIFGRKI